MHTEQTRSTGSCQGDGLVISQVMFSPRAWNLIRFCLAFSDRTASARMLSSSISEGTLGGHCWAWNLSRMGTIVSARAGMILRTNSPPSDTMPVLRSQFGVEGDGFGGPMCLRAVERAMSRVTIARYSSAAVGVSGGLFC